MIAFFAERNIMVSKLGPLGEDVLRKWCSEAGLTRNKAEQDENGWDYLVEFPIRKEANAPWDKAVAPVECKVQVKATRRLRNSVGIKLSNALKMAKCPLPFYLLVLEFSDGIELDQARILPIDGAVAEKILRRVRQCDFEKRSSMARKFAFPWRERAPSRDAVATSSQARFGSTLVKVSQTMSKRRE